MCAHDNDEEFIGAEFQNLFYSFGISDISTTPYNPQGNSICEHLYLKVKNVLRSLIHTNLPRTLVNAKCLIDSVLAAKMYVLHTNVS